LTTAAPTTPLVEVMDKTVLEFAYLVLDIPEGQALNRSQANFVIQARLVLNGLYQHYGCTTFDNAIWVPRTLAGTKVYTKLYRLECSGVVYGGEHMWHQPYAFGLSADLQRTPKNNVTPRGALFYSCKTDMGGNIMEHNASASKKAAAKHYGTNEGTCLPGDERHLYAQHNRQSPVLQVHLDARCGPVPPMVLKDSFSLGVDFVLCMEVYCKSKCTC